MQIQVCKRQQSTRKKLSALRFQNAAVIGGECKLAFSCQFICVREASAVYVERPLLCGGRSEFRRSTALGARCVLPPVDVGISSLPVCAIAVVGGVSRILVSDDLKARLDESCSETAACSCAMCGLKKATGVVAIGDRRTSRLYTRLEAPNCGELGTLIFGRPTATGVDVATGVGRARFSLFSVASVLRATRLAIRLAQQQQQTSVVPATPTSAP